MGQQFDLLPRHLLHSLATVEQRKLLPRAPQLCQLTIVGIVRIPGLARMIHCSRVVPIKVPTLLQGSGG